VIGVSAAVTTIGAITGWAISWLGGRLGGFWSRGLGRSKMEERIRCGEHPLREGFQNVQHARAKRVEASKQEERERELKDERENARPEEHDRILDAGDAVHGRKASG
jgi:hypothetical protein